MPSYKWAVYVRVTQSQPYSFVEQKRPFRLLSFDLKKLKPCLSSLSSLSSGDRTWRKVVLKIDISGFTTTAGDLS